MSYKFYGLHTRDLVPRLSYLVVARWSGNETNCYCEERAVSVPIKVCGVHRLNNPAPFELVHGNDYSPIGMDDSTATSTDTSTNTNVTPSEVAVTTLTRELSDLNLNEETSAREVQLFSAKDHPVEAFERMLQMREENKLCDVILEVDEREIHAHRWAPFGIACRFKDSVS